jgi:hypothetical protein
MVTWALKIPFLHPLPLLIVLLVVLVKVKHYFFFPMHGNHVSTCFEIVYTDVWGVIPIISYD